MVHGISSSHPQPLQLSVFLRPFACLDLDLIAPREGKLAMNTQPEHRSGNGNGLLDTTDTEWQEPAGCVLPDQFLSEDLCFFFSTPPVDQF